MKQSISTSQGDYVLDTDKCDPYTNAELTIQLRLGFSQVNPAADATHGTHLDAGQAERKTVRWGPRNWEYWIQNFVRTAEKYWSERFWLTNNFPVLEFQSGAGTYRPNIACKLKIVASLTHNLTSHFIIDVVKLDPLERTFRSHSVLYDDRDTRPVLTGWDQQKKAIMQPSHVHEVGHLLGLGHVDIGKPHCPVSGDTNASACYGVADVDKNSVMGAGIRLRTEHAMPWRRAMIQLTGRGNAASSIDWSPVRILTFPRTREEAAANKTITARPIR